MVLKKSKKLLEITNTPNAKKMYSEEPEGCHVTPDSEILDLKLEISDDDLFENFQVDMSELRFIR